MEASLDLGAHRPSLLRGIRVMLALAPLAVLAGCCHTPPETPPVEEFRTTPSLKAGVATQYVIDRLGTAQDGDANKIAARLKEALGRSKDPFAGEFVGKMQCRKLGCFAELPAPDARRVLEINQLATGKGSPFSAWSGWRYVSSWYVRESNGPKLMTIVLLDGHSTGVN
jgi:hypothetical protein